MKTKGTTVSSGRKETETENMSAEIRIFNALIWSLEQNKFSSQFHPKFEINNNLEGIITHRRHRNVCSYDRWMQMTKEDMEL
jgi:hypothetical protein